MLIRHRALLSCLAFAAFSCLAFSVAATETVEVRFHDESGTQLFPGRIGVHDAVRTPPQKVEPGPEGTYTLALEPSKKMIFELRDPVTGAITRHHELLPATLPQLLEISVRTSPPPPPPGPPPPNDLCEDAISMMPNTTVSGTTIDSTIEFMTPIPGLTFGPGVWYTVVGTGNTMIASTCDAADYDTRIYIFCDDCDQPTIVAGRDDSIGCPDYTTELEWCSEWGVEYLILVDGFNFQTGDFDLTVSDTGVVCFDAIDCGDAEFIGACCRDACYDPVTSECLITTEFECDELGGEYQGTGTSCLVETDSVSFSDSPGVTIPDHNPAGVVTTIEVPTEESCTIGDLDVEFQITHTWRDDLSIEVIHPDGDTSSVIWDHSCNGENLYVTADDEGFPNTGHNCIVWGVGPSDEITFEPIREGAGTPLSVFDGLQSAGTWFLRVEDTVAQDEGTIDFWALHFTCARSICDFPDADGDGIDDTIDGEMIGGVFVDMSADPFNNSFTDEHLGGTTYGIIANRNGLYVAVENEPESDGVRLLASGAGRRARLRVCDVPVRLAHRNEVVLTCGSLTAEVVQGPVEFPLDTNVVVIVPAGTIVTISEIGGGEYSIENQSPAGALPVVISIDGQESAIGPGESQTVEVSVDDEDSDEEDDSPFGSSLDAQGRNEVDDGLLELDRDHSDRNESAIQPHATDDRLRPARERRGTERRRDSERSR